MKKLKRIMASMLTVLMIFSLFTGSVSALVASDVKDTDFKNHATVLGGLKIMIGDDKGNFRPFDDINRSEVTKIAITLLGLDATSGISKFPDVAEDHWAKEYINTAVAHGIMIGDDKGNFRPDDKITYNEVVTILVRVLGYESQAAKKGGYPTGYNVTASSIGLLKDIKPGETSLINRGNVAVMAYNSLNTNLMEQTGFGSNTKYEVTNKTLLADKLNTTLVTGKVNAVGSAVLDGGSALSKDQIRIGNKNYNTGKTDTRTILGHNAEAYVDNKTKEVVAIIPAMGLNKVIKIDAQNIASVDNSSSKAVNYWDENSQSSKTLKAIVENNAYIVYNGKTADFSKFTAITSGSMSLLDSDSNGKYDIVFVNETINYVVDEVYPNSQKITDKYSNPTLTLDFKDDNKTIILEKGNEYIDLSKLNEWDVITLTISEDESIIFGNVVANPVKGRISQISGDKYLIGDKKYDIAENYPSDFKIGDEGTFYLDYFGKIAGFDSEKTDSQNYAYLENIKLTSGLSKTLKFELFTVEGKFEISEAADKITVNSSKALSHEEAFSAIGSSGKLVTYEKDDSGKIKKITTATTSGEVNEDVFTLNIDESDVIYRESSSKLTGSQMSVAVSNDTVIFDIPQTGSKDDYAVRSKDIFADGALYDVMIFDVSSTYKAGAIIIKNFNAEADEASDIALVQKISLAKNSKGDTVHKLTALMGGKTVELESKDETTFIKSGSSIIKEGDIIQVRTNASGSVDKIKVLFNSEAENTENKTEVSDKLTTVYGRVIKKFSDSVNVQTGDNKAENYEITDAKIYVYDSSLPRNKTRLGDTSDIERYENDGGRVFMRIYKDSVKDIVVIK